MKGSKINFEILYFYILIVFLPFLSLFLYVHPSADDFTYVNTFLEKGFWKSQLFWYKGWSGRYIGTVFLTTSPLITYNIWIYRISLFIILLLLFFSLYFFLKTLFSSYQKKDVILVTGIFLIFYLSIMPQTSSAFYWYAGSATYTLGIVFTLFMFTYMIKYFYEGRKKKFGLLAVLFMFLAVGSNETVMMMIFIVLFFVLLLYYYNKQLYQTKIFEKDVFLLILFFLAIVFSLIVVFAPGNTIRSSYFPNKHHLSSFKQSFLITIKYLYNWIPVAIMLSFLIVYIIQAKSMEIKRKIFRIHPLLAFLLVLVIVYSGFFPSFWSMGSPPPLRTINVIFFFFLVGWLYFTLSLKYFISDNHVFNKPSFVYFFVLIFLSTMIFNPQNNIRKLYSDWLSGRAHKYDKSLRLRYKKIKKFQEGKKLNDTLIVPALNNIPKSIFFNDITNDVKNWKNASYAHYWKIKAIKIENKK